MKEVVFTLNPFTVSLSRFRDNPHFTVVQYNPQFRTNFQLLKDKSLKTKIIL